MERMDGSTGHDAYEMGQFAVQHVGTSPPDVLMHNDVLLIILPNVGHDDTHQSASALQIDIVSHRARDTADQH